MGFICMQIKKTSIPGVLTILLAVFVTVCASFGIFKGIGIYSEAKVQKEKQQELQLALGMYNTESIVLCDTTSQQAEQLAERLQARLRMTEDGSYAVLYLPEGISVEDVYYNDEYKSYLSVMSLDYYVNTEAVDANNRMLVSARPSFVVTDELYPQQNYLDYINLQDTWEVTKGAGVTVAVIDSGIDTDHPDFVGRISERSYDATNDRVVSDYGMEVIEDEDGHGTNVAGVIAANMNNGIGITGIAPEVELLVIKCETDGNGQFLRSSDLVFGLAYAIECDVDVVNMSFGTSMDAFAKYTQLAVDSDIICVAAAGNDGSAMPTYPAADENVIGVGAMDLESWSLAGYSNYGFSLVLAPGTAYTTALNGSYQSATGTSISSPIVTSAIALYLSQNPYTEFSEMCELLKASSVDLGILGEDRQHAFGALDIHALVCEEKGIITYEMLTDELENQTQIFVKGHMVQYVPEPERANVVLDGWYNDIECTDEIAYFEDVFNNDVTLYAAWINEDDGTAYLYRDLDDGTVEIQSYTGRRRYLTIPSELGGKTVTSIGEHAFSGNTRLRSVTLPETLMNISAGAFSDCSKLRAIEIPEKVKAIGDQAFYGCVSLNQVSIIKNSALTTIGDQAFAMCGLSTIHLPVNLTQLGSGAFYGSTGMISITVEAGNGAYQVLNSALYDAAGTTLLYYPAGLTGKYILNRNTLAVADYAFAHTRSSDVVMNDGLVRLGESAFANAHIRTAELPSSLTQMGVSCFSGSRLSQLTFLDGIMLEEIPENAFYSCTNLEYVIIPEKVKVIGGFAFGSTSLTTLTFADNSKLDSIGSSSFEACPLTSVEFPASVSVIGNGAFRNCHALQSIVWESESNLYSVGQSAFEYCTALKRITMPDGLKEVGYHAFFGSGLEGLTIGANLVNLGDGAFSGCGNLQNIDVAEGNSAYISVDGVVFSRDKTVLCIFPAGRSGFYSVPASTVHIANYAFANAEKLTDLELNAGLTEIGGFAFSQCATLSRPILPSSLTTIGDNAFEYCASMGGTLTIPKSVLSIGRFAFFNDYALNEIVIEPESQLSRIGYGTFGYCGITDFTVPRSVSSMGQEVFVGCKNLMTVTFEADSQLTAIAAWTFTGAEELRQITFEEGSALKLLEARSLEGLRKLERVTLENCTQLTTIDNYAFQHCTTLAEVILPESLTEIGRYAFNGCQALSRVDLPEGVSFIGRYAFNNTSNLNVYFRASVLPLNLEENWDYGINGYYVCTADVVTSGDWQYALTSDGKASIVAYTGSEANIVLTTMDGHEIISIGGYAFADNTALQTITLPDSLQGVYQYAFKGTTNLESVSIPASVAIIDNGAFMGSGVSAVSLAENSELVNLGRYVFADTINLTGITIPDGISTIRDYAFQNSGLQKVSFGEHSALTEIGCYAFQSSGLKHITLPAGVTKIDDGAFLSCANLTDVDMSRTTQLQIFANAFYGSGLPEIHIPACVEYVGEFCFAGCENLTQITVDASNENYAAVGGVLYNKAMTKLITCPAGLTGSYTVPDTVMTLGFAAFEGSKLSEVIFPADSQLVTLGYRVFYDCDNLKTIAVPDSVQSIDNYAFAYCDNLSSVTFTENSQLGGIYTSAFYNDTSLTSISIPVGVQEIGDYAFYGCAALTEVDFAENSQLKGIYDYAFAYSGVSEFVMPVGLLNIGTSAFQGAKLDMLVCNDAVVEIGDYAFADCGLSNTTTLEFPGTMEYLGYGTLSGASVIENLTLPFLGTREATIRNEADQEGNIGTLFAVAQDSTHEDVNLQNIVILRGSFVGQHAFACCGKLQTIELPADTIYIGMFSFMNTQLEEIVIPDGTETIDYRAFGGVPLRTVVLPASVTSIESYAFQYTALESVDLPDNLLRLGMEAFAYTQIETIHIPKNVEEIDGAPFGNCPKLKQITVTEDNSYFAALDGILYTKDYSKVIAAPCAIEGSVQLPSGLAEIGYGAFQGCKMTEILFPDTLKSIGANAFENCDGLISVVLPSSVELVGNSCFYACSSLEFADLRLVNNLSYRMFDTCINLTEVLLPDQLSVIPAECFSYCSALETIVIPESVTVIESDAFSYSGIRELNLPKNVSEIGDGIIRNCDNLVSISIDPENPYFISKDGIVYSADCTELVLVPQAITGDVVIPEGVKMLPEGAFDGCKNLESVTLPDSLEIIYRDCFRNCVNLHTINIGKNVQEIWYDAFYNTGYYNDESNWEDGVLYLDNYALKAMNVENLEIRDGTVLLAQWFSMGNDMLQYVRIPDTVKYINATAFQRCNNLKQVILGDGVEIIGSNAFEGCLSLHSFRASENTKYIDGYSFAECLQLQYFHAGAIENSLQWNVFGSYGNGSPFNALKVLAVPYSSEYGLFWITGEENRIPHEVIITTTGNMDTSFLSNVPSDRIIYCYVGKDTNTWPENWNWDSTTYYKDEWHLATFYADNVIITMDPMLLGEVVQAPADSLVAEFLWPGTEFLGWDINGDGLVDELPVTLTEDLDAHAVLRTPVTALKMSETAATMEVTDEKVLWVTYTPRYYSTSGELTWSSSDDTIATVDETGKVTALAEGEVIITATLKEDVAISASCTVTVIPLQPGIRLTETTGTMSVDSSFTLQPRYVQLEEVMDTLTFTSSDETIATVDQAGTITAIAPGTAQITISCGEYTAVYTVTVLLPAEKITISGESSSMNVKETMTLIVLCTPENATDVHSIAWKSSDNSIAQVSASGEVTATAPGTVTITATTESGLTAEYPITVYAPIEWIRLNTSVGTLRLDRTKQMEVIYEPSNTTDDRTVIWSSSNPEIASVSETGLVTGLKAGIAVITGQVGEHTATYEVTVIGLRDEATGITVTNADDTAMREDVELEVTPVDAEELETEHSGVSDSMNEVLGENCVWIVYDISLKENGENVQPDTTVDVEVPIQDNMDKSSIKIYRIESDGTLTDMTAELQGENAYFQTEHFSLYVLGAKYVCEHHSWDEGVVTIPATTETEGEMLYTCTVCGETKTAVIPILQHLAGDINGDGKVNARDVTRLLQYLAEWDVDVVETALDVNGDGKVNVRDVTTLKQYIAGWDVEIS